jgi:conjugal transfer/type IV secretion protein DotA/TraY
MPMPFSPCDPSQPTCNDATVALLQHIFGPIITTLVTGADPNTVSASSSVLAAMIGHFNSGVLVVASLIISYVAAMGTVNTANDGEAMGKAWSSVWTPLRIVSGGAVLLPSASGYSFIQMFVLTLSLWSIGFANGAYKLGMTMGVLKPDGIVASSYHPGTYFGMRDFAKQYLASAYCARSANAVYSNPEQADQTPMVMPDSARPDRKTVTGTRTDYTYYIKDRNPRSNLAGGEPVCGTITLTSYGVAGKYADDSGSQAALDSLRASLSTAKLTATMAMMKDVDGWVATMPSDMGKSGWDTVQSAKLNEIVKKHEDQIAAQIATAMQGGGGAANALKQGSSAFMDSMVREGWSMSASWYQRVGMLRSKLTAVTAESVGSVTQPSMSGLPSDSRSVTLTSSVGTVVETIVKKSEQAGNGYEGSSTPRPEDLSSLLPASAESDINVGALSNDVGTKITLLVNGVMQGATNTVIGSGTDVDAISRMKLTGDLLASYRAILLTAKFGINTAMTAARVVVSGVGGVQVLGTKVDGSGAMSNVWDWLQAEITPVLAELAYYLGLLGFYFSVFLPSLPYMIFTITVVGWVLGVIQTVIAAPLWATMHMRPSQTFIGSDAQGYLLLLALFVRPTLAVIGLFAAMLTADPIVDFITKAFFSMRGDVVSSTGFIGAISQFFTFFWWFSAYGMLLLPVLYMIYGLPQVLPDHVLKWINAGVHDLGATGASSHMQNQGTPAASKAGTQALQQLGGGGGGGGGRGGPNGPGSAGLLRANSNGSSGRSEPINAGQQGIIPASPDGGMKGGSGGGSGGGGGGGGNSRGAQLAGGQGSVGAGTGTSPASNRGLGNKLSDGLGVAIGRSVTDSAMAVKDAAAGGRSGFAGRAATNIKGAMVSAGQEGAAAFQSGADSRIGAFKSEMALRGALQGGPQESGASSATPNAISAAPTSTSSSSTGTGGSSAANGAAAAIMTGGQAAMSAGATTAGSGSRSEAMPEQARGEAAAQSKASAQASSSPSSASEQILSSTQSTAPSSQADDSLPPIADV